MLRGEKIKSIIISTICFIIILSSSLIQMSADPHRDVNVLSIPPVEKYTMLFASDVHMGFPYADDVSETDTSKLIADINYSIHPDSLVFVGDLTDASLDYQWNAFQQALGNISDPVLKDNKTFLAIGNHDINGSISMTANRDNFQNRFGHLPNYTFEIGNILFIVLATQDYKVYGVLSQSQIDWLNSTIAANVNKNIIIVSHHPLQNTTWSTSLEMWGYENSVDQQLHSMMKWQSANVSMWIHGHRHDPIFQPNQSRVVDGITYFNVASVEFQSSPYMEVSWLAEFTEGSKNVSFKPRISNAAVPYWSDNLTRNVSLKFPFTFPPMPTGSIAINSGALYTNKISVALTLNASANVSKILLSNDRVKWTSKEDFSASRPWNLSAVDGSRTVAVRFFDIYGNPSLVYTNSIILDTMPPELTITTPDNTVFQSTSVTINWNTSDTTSGLLSIGVSIDDSSAFNPLSITSRSMSWNNLANGNHYSVVRATDKAGNEILNRIDFQVEASSGGGTSGIPDWIFLTIIVIAIASSMAILILKRVKQERFRPNRPNESPPAKNGRFR